MGVHLFGWLPIRDMITIGFFSLAIFLFYEVKRTKGSERYSIWLSGIVLWNVGMIFDALRRMEGLSALRLVEHSFQLVGSCVITYAAYKTYDRVVKGGE